MLTTFDRTPKELGRTVLQRLVDDCGRSFALDCSVVHGGPIRVGDAVELRPAA